jgi:hypothetical protein
MVLKKALVFATFILLLVRSAGFGQVDLVNTFPYSGTYVKLEKDGYKFYLMDVVAGECRIYNTDFSLWKTVKLNIPANNWVTDIQFVSQNLFNSDDKVELLYVTYEYVETSTSYYYKYVTRIAADNGQVLLDVAGGAYSEVKLSSDGQSRLLVYVWDYSVFPYTVQTRIYSIPGMPAGTGDPPLNPVPDDGFTAYPNPAVGKVNVKIPGMADFSETKLVILNSAGQVVLRQPAIGAVTGIDLEPTGLPSGTYYIKVEGPHYQTKPMKIVYTR